MSILQGLLSVRSIATIIISLVAGFALGSVYSNDQRVQEPEIAADEIVWKQISLYIEQKNVTEADKAITTLRTDYPDSPYCDDALMLLANLQQKEEKYPDAETLYIVVASDYDQGDQYGQSLLQLSDMYIQLQNYEKAETFLTPVEKEFNRLAEGGKLYYNLILSQFLQKKYTDALKTVDRYSVRLPESSELARSKMLQGSIYATYLERPDLAKNIFEGLLSDNRIPEAVRTEATIKLDEAKKKLYRVPTA